MFITGLIAIAALAAPPTVTDYYPLTPGLKRYYEIKGDNGVNEAVEEVGSPVKIKGKEAVPVAYRLSGAPSSYSYYAIEDDTLYMVATSPTQLLNPAIPTLKLGPGRVQWHYPMVSPFAVSPKAPLLTVAAESNSKGKRKVLGQDREIVEVKYSVETPRGQRPRFAANQILTYAAGIGMIEWSEEVVTGDRTVKQKRTLTRFEAPKDSK